MPRMSPEEFASDLAAAKLEGFAECGSLLKRLVDSGLSLRVAAFAVDERANELADEAAVAREKAEASRTPKPEKKEEPTLPAAEKKEEPTLPAV